MKKKPIPEKYRKAIEESNKYMQSRNTLKNEMNSILKVNRK